MNNIVKKYSKGKFVFGEILEIKDNKIILQKVCNKCHGTGKLEHYHYNDEGLCYQCMGTGKGSKTKIDILTDEEIKEDILNRIKDKKAKRKEILPDFIIKQWENYSIDELMKILER